MSADETESSVNVANVLKQATSSLAIYEQQSQRVDLIDAITCCRNGLRLLVDHKKHIEIMSVLSEALMVLFDEEENEAHIEECVNLAKQVVDLTRLEKYDLKRPRYLRLLGQSMALWVERRPRKSKDLDAFGVDFLRESVQLTEGKTSDEAIQCLLSYAFALKLRYRSKLDKEDLNKAIPIVDRALFLTPKGYHLRVAGLFSYARLRWFRVGHMTEKEHLNETACAIEACEEALLLVEEGHRQRPWILNLYGCFLHNRYQKFSKLDDLEGAIEAYKRALENLPNNRTLWFQAKGNYYEALFLRYIRQSQLSDLKEAIEGLRNVIRKWPREQHLLFFYMSILARALDYSFPEFGKSTLLEESIDFYNEALDNALPGTVFYCYRDLTRAYHSQFCAHGERLDLDKAIESIEHAGTLCQHEAFRPQLSFFLGDLLVTRFILSKTRADIDRAISELQHCTDHSYDRDSSHAGEYHSLLGHAFLQRFNAYKSDADLRSAIKVQQTALSKLGKEHSHRALAYSRLGAALLKSFSDTASEEVIDAAVDVFRSAVQLTRSGHSVRAAYQAQLGMALSTRARDGDATAAIDIFRDAAMDRSSFIAGRYEAATGWANIAHEHHQLERALEGYQLAVDLLPQVAWLGLSRDQRLQRLSAQSSDLCQNAAACAIELKRYKIAVELLDHGRSIFWNTSQNLRSDLSHLRVLHPHLAEELQNISAALDSRALQGYRVSPIDQEVDARSHRRHAERWTELVDTVREQDGFHNFLRPVGFSDLSCAAKGGVIALVNASRFRSDALLITENVVRLVPLHSVNREELDRLAGDLKDALLIVSDEMTNEVFLRVLRRLWNSLGNMLWDGIQQLVPHDATPRVWWCLAGVVSRLPLHACGPYERGTPGMADLVVSSHTPTLSALLRAKLVEASPTIQKPPFSLLAIGLGDIPGKEGADLPYVREELEALKEVLVKWNTLLLEGPEASREQVMKKIKQCGWFHVAAHTVQCHEQPLESHLLLYDEVLSLAHIAEERLPFAELAYISACRSAESTDALLNEALHFASGMLLAGFRGVVATLWMILDDDGPLIAKEFYKYLTRDGRAPDIGDAAHALHLATLRLRQDPSIAFWRWISFVHLGV